MSDETDEQRRARRRAVAREHHPDRGGDPAEFDRAMRALDTPDDAPAPRRHEIVLTPSTRTRLRRRATTARRTARARAEQLLRDLTTTSRTRLTRRAP